MNIPFLDLAALHEPIQQQLNDASQRVLNSGWFIMGPELEAFEEEFAAYNDVKHCMGVGNGLEALHLLLKAYDIGPDDEVIVPSNTFIATWLAVSECGATPIPVEPLESTYNLNPDLIEQKISSRTKAIIPVHLYGQTADMDKINEIAHRYHLVVIEDAAQSQGARYQGRRAGSLGHSAATSFYPGKNLGALGDGGAILTNDASIAEKVKLLRNYGSEKKYHHKMAGFNSRLDELQAAFLRVKLRHLDEWNQKRQNIATHYSYLLKHSEFILPEVPVWAEPVWHLYVIRCSKRDELQQKLEQANISTGIHYPIPPHKQQCYGLYDQYRLPVAEQMAKEVLSLPISPAMHEDEVSFIVEKMLQFSKQSQTHQC